MKINWNSLTQEPKYWIAAIATGVIAIHLTLVSRVDNPDLFATSAFLWGGAAFLIWEKRETLKLESDIFSSFLGATLTALALLKSTSIYGYDIFLRFLPLIAIFSVGLLASSFKGLKQYWQQFILFCFVAIPPTFVLKLIPLEVFTAKFSALALWYLGFPIIRQGTFLILPKGSVEVYDGCSGINVILQLLSLTCLGIFMFPEIKRWQKIIAPFLAIFVGFVVNSIRVGLLAILISWSSRESFDYWHQGDGSLIFSMIAVAIFGLLCWFIILREPEENPEPKPEENLLRRLE